MSARNMAAPPTSLESDTIAQLLRQYGCGPIQFTGTDNAFYERHLVFDNVIELTTAGARERFEAVAHAVRDVLAQRWVQTEQTYERDNPKRVYYLCLLYTSPSPRDGLLSRMPSSA